MSRSAEQRVLKRHWEEKFSAIRVYPGNQGVDIDTVIDHARSILHALLHEDVITVGGSVGVYPLVSGGVRVEFVYDGEQWVISVCGDGRLVVERFPVGVEESDEIVVFKTRGDYAREVFRCMSMIMAEDHQG